MAVTHGTYTGDGLNARAFSGLGFTPACVMVRADNSNFMMIRTGDMAGDATVAIDNNNLWAFLPDMIQSLDVDGFTVGTGLRVNADGVTYYWMAFEDSDEFSIGTYIGNGADERVIDIGFEPAWVFVLTDQVGKPVHIFQHDTPPGIDYGHQWDDPTILGNELKQIVANGFEIGTDAKVNTDTVVYYWGAFHAQDGVMVRGEYDGNGVDNRSISGVGFPPTIVWIHEHGGATTYFKTASLPGELTLRGQSGSNSASDRIQALEDDGFQVSGHNEVNQFGIPFAYLAMGGVPAEGGSWKPTWEDRAWESVEVAGRSRL